MNNLETPAQSTFKYPSTWNVLLLTNSFIFHRNVISAEKSLWATQFHVATQTQSFYLNFLPIIPIRSFVLFLQLEYEFHEIKDLTLLILLFSSTH